MVVSLLTLAGCGGGGGGSAPPPPETSTYTLGGTVSGLTGAGLVLRNNGGNDLAIAASGDFSFVTPLASGAAYGVSVYAQPAGQSCAVSNGAGTVAGVNVTHVAVSCRGWGVAALIEKDDADAYDPQIAIDASGNALAVWAQRDGARWNIWANRYQ